MGSIYIIVGLFVLFTGVAICDNKQPRVCSCKIDGNNNTKSSVCNKLFSDEDKKFCQDSCKNITQNGVKQSAYFVKSENGFICVEKTIKSSQLLYPIVKDYEELDCDSYCRPGVETQELSANQSAMFSAILKLAVSCTNCSEFGNGNASDGTQESDCNRECSNVNAKVWGDSSMDQASIHRAILEPWDENRRVTVERLKGLLSYREGGSSAKRSNVILGIGVKLLKLDNTIDPIYSDGEVKEGTVVTSTVKEPSGGRVRVRLSNDGLFKGVYLIFDGDDEMYSK